jgi:hypothetical protein
MPRRSFDGSALYVGKQTAINPSIPETLHKEVPVTELLVEHVDLKEREKQIDHRGIETKPFEPIFHPQYNRLYSTLRTEADWRYTVDNYAAGNFTTIANATVSTAVTLTVTQDHKRLSEWPNGVQLYLVVRQCAVSPTTATFATVGSVDLRYQDSIGGQLIPLGVMLNNTNFNQGYVTLIPTPITDPGVINVGNILAFLNTGATVGTYLWQISFSYAYLLPTDEPHQFGPKAKGGDIHVNGSTAHTRINTVG